MTHDSLFESTMIFHYNVNKNSLDDIMGFIPEKGLTVIAHRMQWGEEKLLADLIVYYDSLGIRTELWNLNRSDWPVVDPRIFSCSITNHKIYRDHTVRTGMVQTKRIWSEMSDTDISSAIIVCGIQEMQYYSFDRNEMKSIMEKMKRFALTRDKPVILFSYIGRVRQDENDPLRVLTTDELDQIGISEEDACIIHLDNLYRAPKIGPFFCIDDLLLADRIELYEGQKQEDKLYNPCSHKKLFERNYRMIARYEGQKQAGILDDSCGNERIIDKKYLDLDYIDFPRGRVVWDITRDIAIIYIDPCIGDKIDEIAYRFSLTEYSIEEDDHHRCKKLYG